MQPNGSLTPVEVECAMDSSEGIGEGFSSRKRPVPYLKLLLEQGYLTPSIIHHQYPGTGTEADPYLVEWIDNDPRNPMLFSDARKWVWTLLESLATFAVALTTSAYSAAAVQLTDEFQVDPVLFEVGFSVFVLGFALGPLFWAPLSEMYGRQVLFFMTLAMFTAFNAASIVVPTFEGLIVLRFLKGSFGSSLLTNAGGVVADIFPASQRGLAIVAFSSAPLLGPVLGPVIGGFLAENLGWRWMEGFLTILSGTLWILVSLVVPETYSPVLLERRVQKLSKLTGKTFISKLNKDKTKNLKLALKTALTRPWVLLFREPIVLLLSIYMAILYGTLYMFFGAFRIVYQGHRGWSEGIGGLAFLGIGVGVILGIAYSFPDHRRYQKALRSAGGKDVDPEVRLPPSLVGSIAIPIGIFWFAWINSPSVHFLVSIAGQIPFGFGFVLVYLTSQNYLVDAYTIYAASVLAANTVMRSAVGAAFPLFTPYMYDNLGIHWASSVPAFLALACVPFPFLFYKFGVRVRKSCKYAAEADRVRRAVHNQG